MSGDRATAASIGGVALLERAITYTLGSLHLVTPAALARPTPCPDWDLAGLLRHLDDSLLTLYQAAELGRVDVVGPADERSDAVDLVAGLRGRACRLLGAWTAAVGDHPVAIAGHRLTTGLVTGTGAVEIAVHGWDVARSCGAHRPVPPALADELLDLASLFVSPADRPHRFAAPVDLPPGAGPGDRLIAFLGRRP